MHGKYDSIIYIFDSYRINKAIIVLQNSICFVFEY